MSRRLVAAVGGGCLVVALIGLPLTPTSAGNGAAGDPRVSALTGRLAAGGAHSCTVDDRGRVVCWGEGTFGALGYGNTEHIGDDEVPADNQVGGGFVALPGGGRARSVGAGGSTTCAVMDDGRVVCWGLGSSVLGYGNTTTIGDNETPAQNGAHGGFVPLAGRVETLAVGPEHRCAVLEGGDITCWGRGDDGRLGYGNTTTIGDDETPADNPVSNGLVPLPTGASAVAVAAGGRHTCALLDSGAVTCWGANDHGQLGYGNAATIGDDETPAQNPVNDGLVPLPMGATAIGITAGDDHTCALLDIGQVSCWGEAANGRLGYGNTNDIGDDESPADNPVGGGAVPLMPGRTATQIVAGSAHTCAVLDTAE